MGEAKRRKQLDSNFGKVRNVCHKKTTKAQERTVIDLLKSGKFEELAHYIIDNNIYVPARDKNDRDWNSVEEVEAWAEQCYEQMHKAANMAKKKLTK